MEPIAVLVLAGRAPLRIPDLAGQDVRGDVG